MVELFLLPLFTLHILHQLVAPTTSTEVNSTLIVKSVGSSGCVKGKQYYDTDQEKCRRCPRCRKATNYLQFNIRISPEFGALDCYPCYCKLGVKFKNEYSDRCSECPICYTHGHINKNKEIPSDEFHGAFDCYPCICDPGYFGNALTHHQCTECLDCHGQNKQFKTNCTQTTDSECGDCLIGYTKSWMEHAACVKIETTIVTPKLSSTPETRNLPAKEDNGHAKKSQTILVVILMISTFSAFGVIFLVYYVIKHSSCCSKAYYNVTASTSAATLTSRSSMNKNDNSPGQMGSGSSNSAGNVLLSERTDFEQSEDPHLECDGLLTENHPQNVRRTSDDKNIYYIIQKGDCNDVHINSLPSTPS
ncbi:tumor necrosis factor receptor superfamily member 27 [Mytilus galloprovincialis]|uniref:Tumor necrosis factor receptor superfamily member 27 n=1 Tax=Mytilus galloprovincialis TaxID=29158 RepID=A0A8B6CYW9_MYTGA|nr:tumor necrosis factor receptor superfamily member 27 [Mytilus galloprovincialis]